MLCLVQSAMTGRFLVPMDGAVGWTQSLRQALKFGLLEESEAHELAREEADEDADVIPVRHE